jgi:succinylglutamic semialdehyde dehydrogenase
MNPRLDISENDLISKNPATSQVVWQGKSASKEQIDYTLQQASAAFDKWCRTDLDERVQIIQKFQEILISQKEQVAECISQETGKPFWEALQECDSMIAKVPITLRAFKERCLKKEETHLSYKLAQNPKPHGVVAVFGPFNMPGQLSHGHIIPALLAGNAVVFKCSEYTPNFGVKIKEVWDKTGVPKGVFNLLQGGKQVGAQIAKHPLVKGIFFTGSFQGGLAISQELGHLPHKILALEMGGNNPLIISDIEDSRLAAYLTIQSAFLTTGQRCSCARRLILVDNPKNREFLDLLSHMITQLLIGPYTLQPEPFMGPLISMRSAQFALKAQEKLIHLGGVPLVPMRPIEKDLPFVTPGLMDVTNISSPDAEIFAPFLQVIKVPSFQAAIVAANNTQYGLTASIFTQKRGEFEEFFYKVDAGVINWNTPTTRASSSAAFGGVKNSGNYHPSGYTAGDYCCLPISSLTAPLLTWPKILTPGLLWK